MKLRHLIIALMVGATSLAASADNFFDQNTFEYHLGAGINIGGAAPLPIPGQIRHIDNYGPGLHFSVGATIIKWFDTRWGMAIAPRFENKGMITDATTSNYGMSIIQDGIPTTGFWTGKVNTRYHQEFFTLPILAEMRVTPRWRISAGPWVSVTLSRDFSGHVSDGYLCPYTPGSDTLGERIYFGPDNEAPYDFSDELRNFQWGVEAGAAWRAYRHFWIEGRLEWGLSEVFKSSFKTISFPLYPIYLNLGFSYQF